MGVTQFSVILLVSSALLIKESYAEAVSKDYCVVGAGPAGLQIGSFLSTANRDYVIFERGSAAGKLDCYYKKLKASLLFDIMPDWPTTIYSVR